MKEDACQGFPPLSACSCLLLLLPHLHGVPPSLCEDVNGSCQSSMRGLHVSCSRALHPMAWPRSGTLSLYSAPPPRALAVLLDLAVPLRRGAQGSLWVLPWQCPYMCCILGRRSSCHVLGLKTEM